MSTICQSCGMPLEVDPKKGGTNADQSISTLYCSFCFENGAFKDEGITLEAKIEKNVHLAMAQFNYTETEARAKVEALIPNLGRWKSSQH
ncbi:zinc ribbon domain-containing protein [Flavobacterium sp. SUN046]|uniref:zinc ribbon domain-containing protein n=1 Tax=Flavobacterium sp. SUN046 TaxID=3002440 RepID=UPI002DBDF97A|nr:zinc ribbon domain-containing protein [Flavobacterium sp. SUN046]MEC4050344.1 zinc ribbon domain-containing protein [Flavobacterium sp. SUN046]